MIKIYEEKENSPIKNPAIKKGDASPKEENKEDNQKEGNNSSKVSWRSLFSSPAKAQKDKKAEEEQDMMEKALDLLEVADNYWEKGDVENTLNTLDKAYALILDANGDVAIAQAKR